MAKKKKKKSKGKKSRSRMNGFDSTTVLAVVAGVAAGAFADKGIKMLPDSMQSSLNGYTIGGGKMAIGLGLPFLVKDSKQKAALTAFGAGMAGVGLLNILSESGVMSGVNDGMPLIVDLSDRMNANVLGGIDDLNVMNADVLGNSRDINVMNGAY